MSEDITPAALPDGADITPTDGDGTASQDAGVAKVLSSALGKDFKDDDTALKAVKDTFKYVGGMGKYKGTIQDLEGKLGVSGEEAVLQRMEEIANQVTQPAAVAPVAASDDVKQIKQQLDDMTFYKANPQLESHANLLTEMRGNTGKSLSDIASSEVFKSVLDKATAYDKVQESKSVLDSNPRLGSVRDKMADARKAAADGNMQAAKQGAVSAVLSAYDIT
jgi:hypothetical protein